MLDPGGRVQWVPVLMSPDQVRTLRRLVLNDADTTAEVMSGKSCTSSALGGPTEALVRIVTLFSLDSDPAAFRWAVEIALASGLEDDAIFEALMVMAPIIGIARLSSTLPRLMEAMELEVVEG